MTDVLHIEPKELLNAIRPLSPHQALHMLDSMTWFPSSEHERWTGVADYVGARTKGDTSHDADTYNRVYNNLANKFGLKEESGVAERSGRWKSIPSPKGTYQLKYAIKALMLPDEWFDCMNMGYATTIEADAWITPPAGREIMQYSLQLYDYVAKGANIGGRRVLEVGSGRGGGGVFLANRYSPLSFTGLELCGLNVDFSRGIQAPKSVSFIQGDAELVPLADNSYDVAINIESAHCYPNITSFFREMGRVLVPEGRLLLATEWWRSATGDLHSAIKNAGFKIESEEDITENVLTALNRLETAFPVFLKRSANPERLHLWEAFFRERVCRDSRESYLSRRFGFFNFVLVNNS